MTAFYVYLLIIFLASLITAHALRKEKEFSIAFLASVIFYGIICIIAETVSYTVHLLAGFMML